MSVGESIIGGIAALLLTFGTAFVGTRFPVDQWYAQIAKPTWNPPSWLFAPVWTLLYFMMAVAVWLVWREHGVSGAALPLVIFVVQLALNAAWSWIFFGRHQIGLAATEIMILWAAILGVIAGFWRLEPVSGALLIPYLLWVSFAAALNIAIWRLNKRSPNRASG
jgi:tryptophan-rich sensory protein